MWTVFGSHTRFHETLPEASVSRENAAPLVGDAESGSSLLLRRPGADPGRSASACSGLTGNERRWYSNDAAKVAFMSKDFSQIHVRLTNEQIEWLNKKSDEHSASRAQIIRSVILRQMAIESCSAPTDTAAIL